MASRRGDWTSGGGRVAHAPPARIVVEAGWEGLVVGCRRHSIRIGGGCEGGRFSGDGTADQVGRRWMQGSVEG